MFAACYLVAVLTGLVSVSSSDDTCWIYNSLNQQPSTTLRYVYGFFRHGIRSPLYEPYPNDPHKSKYHHYFPGNPGKLTKVGEQKMYKVGQKLKLRYGNFVGAYTEEKVYVSSTNMSRTTLSVLCVMAGMFPPCKPVIKGLNWLPVPVWQNTSDLDKAYIYNDEQFPKLGLQVCPKYGKLIQTGYNVIINPDKTEDRLGIYQLVQNYTGKSDVNSVNTLYKIWDTLQFESLNGLPLPKWATAPQPTYQNRILYPDLMQPIMVEWFLDAEYLHNNTDMMLFYSGPLFDSIHKHLKEKIQNPHLSEKLRLHGTHDTTLFILLWTLGVWDPATVGPGDGILFELHSKNSFHTVKVIYFNAKYNTFKELVLPMCPPPCTLPLFIKTTQGLTPHQWQERCTQNNIS